MKRSLAWLCYWRAVAVVWHWRSTDDVVAGIILMPGDPAITVSMASCCVTVEVELPPGLAPRTIRSILDRTARALVAKRDRRHAPDGLECVMGEARRIFEAGIAANAKGGPRAG